MIVTVHQPEHLPCLGLFAKMARADLFVSLDTVPFRKNYYQNRNRILGHDRAPAWLTVPVRLDDHLESSIAQVGIAGDGRWRRKYARTLQQRYARHPHGSALLGSLAAVVERDHAGIELRVHDYEHPRYPQRGAGRFVSHLSAVDALCSCGPAAGELLREGSRVLPFPRTADRPCASSGPAG